MKGDFGGFLPEPAPGYHPWHASSQPSVSLSHLHTALNMQETGGGSRKIAQLVSPTCMSCPRQPPASPAQTFCFPALPSTAHHHHSCRNIPGWLSAPTSVRAQAPDSRPPPPRAAPPLQAATHPHGLYEAPGKAAGDLQQPGSSCSGASIYRPFESLPRPLACSCWACSCSKLSISKPRSRSVQQASQTPTYIPPPLRGGRICIGAATSRVYGR